MIVIHSKKVLLVSFSRRLKSVRTQRNLSQKEVAILCKMDFSSYANIENGKRNITLFTLHRILSILDISFKEFFDY
jgi:transcriptional regulator with XRE-family HTH domain